MNRNSKPPTYKDKMIAESLKVRSRKEHDKKIEQVQKYINEIQDTSQSSSLDFSFTKPVSMEKLSTTARETITRPPPAPPVPGPSRPPGPPGPPEVPAPGSSQGSSRPPVLPQTILHSTLNFTVNTEDLISSVDPDFDMSNVIRDLADTDLVHEENRTEEEEEQEVETEKCQENYEQKKKELQLEKEKVKQRKYGTVSYRLTKKESSKQKSENAATIKRNFKNKYLTIAGKLTELQPTPDYLLLVKDNIHDPNNRNPSQSAGRYIFHGEGPIKDRFLDKFISYNSKKYCHMSDAVHFKEQALRIRSQSKVEESFTTIGSDAPSQISEEEMDSGTRIYSRGNGNNPKADKKKNEEKKKRKENARREEENDVTKTLPPAKRKSQQAKSLPPQKRKKTQNKTTSRITTDDDIDGNDESYFL